MNRCALGAVLTAACLFLPFASAQELRRNFPAQALRGEISFTQPPELLVNGQRARLAPGSRIRAENNLLATPASLAGRKAVAHYTVDELGLVKDVWLLTADEQGRKPWPRTPAEASAWQFDPVGQTWSKP